MLNHIVRRGVAHLQAAAPDYMARDPPVLFTGIIVFLILASIRYTLGDVVASLAMIESPSTTAAIVEHKLQLSRLLRPLERPRNQHLYSIAYGLVSSILSGFLGALGHPVASILASLLLVRLHMLWTHTMIAHPPTKPLLQRIVPPGHLLVPLGVAYLLDLPSAPDAALRAAEKNDCAALASLALRVLAVPLTAALIALFVLLPASATLTRIEAALLPADMQPIVAFDRAASSATSTSPCAARAVLSSSAAWRSFDCAARVRILKLLREDGRSWQQRFTLIGGERLTVLFTIARAQLELMAIEAQQISTSRFDPRGAEFDIEKYLHVLADSITAAKETPVNARHHGPTNGNGGTSSKAAADSVAPKADVMGQLGIAI
ncbi:hypothetical protein B0H14DRAFT_3736354 [Mycena olivaceomarginata]|nr:hypothetical protein B0H14DRAFT_3736354 [Mycena olivaceomarginata]